MLVGLPIYWRGQPETIWHYAAKIKEALKNNEQNILQLFWVWLKQQRVSLSQQDFIQDWKEDVPRQHRKAYALVAVIDTFCYLFWFLSASVPGYIEWNIDDAVELRRARSYHRLLSPDEERWLSKQVPHLIFAGFNLYASTP